MGEWIFIKKILRYVFGGISVFFVMIVTFEILSIIAIKNDLISAETPNYLAPSIKPFWVDDNPNFGVWHPSNAEYTHTKSCFSVRYYSNSYGARDKERLKKSHKRRVLVIGDSFVEGFGLKSTERTTDLLEQKTGIEHLNFATSGHFGPTQYFLLYKHLANQFSHDAVIVGLLPDNDFTDDDPEHGKSNLSEQYRPYFVEEGKGYKLVYQNLDKHGVSKKQLRREKRLFFKRALQNFTYSVNAINYFSAILSQKKIEERMNSKIVKVYSGFTDYSPDQMKRMEYVVGKIIREVAGRPLIWMVIPRANDLSSLPNETTLFVKNLKKIVKPFPNVSILDLHQKFKFSADWSEYYRSCDNHWSAAGAAQASEYVMGHPAYQNFLNSSK
jgi:hypothetical protein